MTALSAALQMTETACGAVSELVFDGSQEALQDAMSSMVAALGSITEALLSTPAQGSEHCDESPKPPPAPKKVRAKVNGHEPELSATEKALDVVSSAWDPDPASSRIESSRCRALLLEIVKRAIHDWVLYRGHSEITKATYAREAYMWLFEEEEDHPDFKDRVEDGNTITSFIVICELNDLRPEELREHIRTLRVSDIMGTGRPAERRRRSPDDVSIDQHDLAGVKIESFEPSPNHRHQTYLEAHYAPNQLGYT